MAQYVVKLRGECREVYFVEAESEDEARENWASGWYQTTVSQDMEVVSVDKMEEEK